MESDGAGGIYLEFVRASFIGGLLPENNLSRRRAADISQTDKQDSEWSGLGVSHGRVIGGNAAPDNVKMVLEPRMINSARVSLIDLKSQARWARVMS